MLTNYLKIAWRNLVRYRGFSAINILGLAIGMACCLVIFLFVRDELRFDAFHAKGDRIYRLITYRTADGMEQEMPRTPPAFGPTLKATFPEVEQSVRLFQFGNKIQVAVGEQKFFEKDMYLADSTFFTMFSFPLLAGNPTQVLNEPNTIVISETLAKKYFGNRNPINQVLTIESAYKYRITGVMRDVPAESHLALQLVGSFSSLRDLVGAQRLESWRWHQLYTYFTLAPGTDAARLEAKLPAFHQKYAGADLAQGNSTYRYWLQPLADVHLRSSDFQMDIARRGDIRYVYAFSVVALFTLLIACFNFMNLSTARSARRAREVGLRKTVGAERTQLIAQFLGESVLQTGLALVLALVLAQVSLGYINDWVGKTLSLRAAVDPVFVLSLLAGGLFVSLLAGSYPAFFLSGFRPLKVLKGDIRGSAGGALLRKNLVVLQFTVSIMLMIGAGIVYYQIQYIQRKNLGFDQQQLVSLPIYTDAMRHDVETIKADLLQNPAIAAATSCYGVPGGTFATDGLWLPDRNKDMSMIMFLTDVDYIPTMGMKMVAGRNFSRSFPSDSSDAFILNETAVKELGWGSPANAIGKPVEWRRWAPTASGDSLKRGKIIGVVKDFHQKTIHQKIEPLVMHIAPAEIASIVVRIRPENTAATLAFLEKKWQAMAGEWLFTYTFLDQNFAEKYRSEQTFGQVFALFTFLSLFITCLGLFGLAAFTAEQRTKEIGVRKVLGASVSSILLLLSKDFLKLVLIALLIATPIAWYAMHRWLQSFAYKIDLEWWLFAGAGLLAILIALLTVSSQSLKAALMNPVKSLKTE